MSPKQKNNQLRVGVIGVGPVGSILAAHLAEAGAFVVVCDKATALVDNIRKSGIQLTNLFAKQVPVEAACYTIQELGAYDLELIILAVKTPVLGPVVEQLHHIDNGIMMVMCAQNGIDNEQQVAQLFGAERTLRMVINYAGNLSDGNLINVSFFNPPNYVAALRPDGEPLAGRLADLLTAVQLETAVTGDIQDHVWEKAILNSALSAVCAITKRTMKEVLDFTPTLELIEAIIDESVRVAEAEGIELDKDFRQACIHYLKSAGNHRPSMLVDLDNGRETEIASLNGKIVDYGHRHSMPTPLNLAVSVMVQLMQQNPE